VEDIFVADTKALALDLSKLTPEQIGKFRNVALASVIRPISDLDAASTHDRHYSEHSRDASRSMFLRAEVDVLPEKLFDGLREIDVATFAKNFAGK
jgi:hypothetical protein